MLQKYMIRMKMNFRHGKRSGRLFGMAALAGLLILAGCDHDRNHPGWDYFPDMFYSPAYETYAPNPNTEKGRTMPEPVPGTVPREMIPFDYEKTEEDMIRAGKELKNPLPVTEAHVERGKVAYEYFCISCHGDKGDGEGYLYTRGWYAYPPASLINEKMIAKPEGEIYHSITVGYGIMGAHGPLIRPDDRWKIIHYIREELQDAGTE